MTNNKKALLFIHSAFDDYVSGRFLLINNYPLNGAISASTAIEKYFKAILTLLNIEPKFFHFDKIDKIKKQFSNTQYDVLFRYSDPKFFEILSTAYSFRYLDKIDTKTTLGFSINQLLAELDYNISLIETLLSFNIDGKPTATRYQKAVADNDIRVYQNNYVLNKIDKKEFCETVGYYFGMVVDPPQLGPILAEAKIVTPYQGGMTTIKFNIVSD